MIRKYICLILTLLVLVQATACSAFRPFSQTVNVSCTPADAVLMVNGERYTSPAQVRVKRNRDLAIQAYKEGYVPYQRTIASSFNVTGMFDVIGAVFFLVPGIGLFFPGAWSLDETDVSVSLFKE